MKIEFNITYFFKINWILERKNSLIVIKPHCLLFDPNMNQLFLLQGFVILVFFFNKKLFFTLDYNILPKAFLKTYYNNYQFNYIQQFNHLHF